MYEAFLTAFSPICIGNAAETRTALPKQTLTDALLSEKVFKTTFQRH